MQGGGDGRLRGQADPPGGAGGGAREGKPDRMTLDPAALEELRELGGAEFVAELVDTFLADAPALLAGLHGTDVEEVRRSAHTLKSNGLTLGAAGFAAACAELEALARGGDLAGAEALAERIDHEYTALVDALGPYHGA